MSSPRFRFVDAVTTRGTITGTESANEFMHPVLPTKVYACNGFSVVLNGYNLNRKQADYVGYDGTTGTALTLLQMRAPRQPIRPLISGIGTGRMFRPGAKWRYRWYDSRTGEYSGLSPVPETEINMGVETPVNGTTFLGQTAYFYLAVAGRPPHADTVQLFANTTRQDETWYLADSVEIASGASYVLLVDDSRDDELFLKEAVVTGAQTAIPEGFSWNEGVMWPLARAWEHPSGRLFYFGMRRMGRFGPVTARVTVNEGSDLCTLESSSTAMRLIHPNRVGQRVRFFSALATQTGIEDPTVYRFVKAESATTFRVTPDIQVSTELAEDASDQWYFAIEDDRDARWTYMSEPNKPWLIDPLKVVAAGDDYDDGVMAWFSIGDRIFMQTRRRIYEAMGSMGDNPAGSTLFQPRADEGIPGFDCGCETPFGWVFVHERRGVRVFDGAIVRPLGESPDPYADFAPASQFAAFEPSMIGECVVAYDDENRVVLVSYVPTGQGTRKEVMAFDTAERRWRGPYRDRISAVGRLRSTDSLDYFVTGDDFGNLMTREEQVLDVVPTVSGLTTASDLTSFTDERFFADTANAFDDDGDSRLRGSPIWFTRTSDGALFFARIADIVSGTEIETDGLPVDEDGVAWNASDVLLAYEIGSLRWVAVSAYIDEEGDPANPVTFYKCNVRFHRGTSSETFEIGAAEDASGTYAGTRISSSSAAAPTEDVNGEVHGELRLRRRGSLIQLRTRGLSSTGQPQITRIALISKERSGAKT